MHSDELLFILTTQVNHIIDTHHRNDFSK
jgi:hypothetical protein